MPDFFSKEKVEALRKKLISKKWNIKPLLISLAITVFFLGGHYLFGNYFIGTMWIINAVVLGVLLSIIMLIAGFAVLKSLFFVSAELSLLIFLAQSYCDAANRSNPGDEALRSLLMIGVIYVVFSFCRSLYEVMKEYYKTVENKAWSKEKIGVIVLFLSFAYIFIQQIYLVVSPIVLNLCVYK